MKTSNMAFLPSATVKLHGDPAALTFSVVVSCSKDRPPSSCPLSFRMSRMRAAHAGTTKFEAEAPAARQLTNRHPGTLKFLIRGPCLANWKVSPFSPQLLVTTLNLLRNPNKGVLNRLLSSNLNRRGTARIFPETMMAFIRNELAWAARNR
jgi:hypothetical protein